MYTSVKRKAAKRFEHYFDAYFAMSHYDPGDGVPVSFNIETEADGYIVDLHNGLFLGEADAGAD